MAATEGQGYAAVIPWRWGRLGLRIEAGVLTAIDFLPPDGPLLRAQGGPARAAVAVLEGYFADPQRGIELALDARGSPFQRRIWALLRQIPAGRTISYGELARRAGSSARAVGGACRANPIPILIPCHRVVAAHGLGGFTGQSGGQSLAIKRWLLEHERALAG